MDLDHSGNVQILDRNAWFGFRQLTGDLIACVAADIGHTGVCPGQFRDSLASVIAPFLAAGDDTLQSFDLCEVFLACARVGLLGAIYRQIAFFLETQNASPGQLNTILTDMESANQAEVFSLIGAWT